MVYSSRDPMDHSVILFNHLDRFGKIINELFNREVRDGVVSGQLQSGKLDTVFVSAQWFESIMIAFLGKEYDKRKKDLVAEFFKARKNQDWIAAFMAMNSQMQILILEAFNRGFLISEAVRGEKDDHIIDQEEEENQNIGLSKEH